MKNKLIKSLVSIFLFFIFIFFLIYGFLNLNPLGSSERIGEVINTPIPEEIISRKDDETSMLHANQPDRDRFDAGWSLGHPVQCRADRRLFADWTIPQKGGH